METWRRVEVAACEEMPRCSAPDGPTPEELEAIRAATFTVEAVARARARHRPRRRRVRRRARPPRPVTPGRWIHFGLTSSDVLDTALALQLRAAGELIVPGARELVAALAERAREHVAHAVRRAHARRARRADDVRHQARRLRVRGAPQRRAARARLRAGRRRRDLRRRRHLRRDQPDVRGARARARSGSAREDGLDAGRRARPPRRAAQRDRARRRRARALATEIRHLQRTEVREVEEPFRAGQKGSSAMPHKRNPIKSERITGLARVLRGNAQAGARERRAVARARHLALRASSA